MLWSLSGDKRSKMVILLSMTKNTWLFWESSWDTKTVLWRFLATTRNTWLCLGTYWKLTLLEKFPNNGWEIPNFGESIECKFSEDTYDVKLGIQCRCMFGLLQGDYVSVRFASYAKYDRAWMFWESVITFQYRIIVIYDIQESARCNRYGFLSGKKLIGQVHEIVWHFQAGIPNMFSVTFIYLWKRSNSMLFPLKFFVWKRLFFIKRFPM